MIQPDEIRDFDIPKRLPETCRHWASFTGHNIVDQIDSGL